MIATKIFKVFLFRGAASVTASRKSAGVIKHSPSTCIVAKLSKRFCIFWTRRSEPFSSRRSFFDFAWTFEIKHRSTKIAFRHGHFTRVSRAWIDPLPFLEIKCRPNNGYHVKEHKKLCRNSEKKSTLSRQKKSYGGSKVGFGTFFSSQKNEKNACKTLYRLARIFI